MGQEVAPGLDGPLVSAPEEPVFDAVDFADTELAAAGGVVYLVTCLEKAGHAPNSHLRQSWSPQGTTAGSGGPVIKQNPWALYNACCSDHSGIPADTVEHTSSSGAAWQC